MAPGLAMARVGASLQGAGNVVGEIQTIHDEGVKSQARIEMQTAYNEHAQYRAENADETTWGDHASKTTEAAWKRIEKLRMSPAMQAELKTTFDGWGQNFQAGVKLDATKQTIATARQRVSNAYEADLQAGRFDHARTTVQSSLAYTPVEREKILLGINDREKDYQRSEGVRQAINLGAGDAEWLDKHPAGTLVPGLDEVATQQVRRGIMAMRAAEADEFSSKIEDMIAVGVTDEQIIGLGTGQRPSVVAELVQSNQRRNQANYAAEIRKPEVQAQIIGEARRRMLRYDPTDERTFDSERAAILGLVRRLPDDNPVKGELESNLSAMKSGKQEEIKTASKSAQRALDAHFKTTVLDKLWDGDSGQPTQKAINDKFLEDTSKLASLGLSKGQWEDVLGGKINGEAPKTLTNTARENAFKALWEQRADKNAHPGGLVEATALAIVNGEPQIKFAAPKDLARAQAARTSAEIRWGQQTTELAQFLKVNPKASSAEIETKLLKLTGSALHADVSKSLIPARPSAARLASPGDRITSYGYSGDPTPDRNSSAGIGAWVGDAEAARIRAGENTPNKLRAGDLAVSRDVESRLLEAGIEPGQSIRLKLSDGSTVAGRWMDRTADAYKGHTLKNRFDLYSPDGVSQLDGRTVVSWSLDK
jgi:hypothetical protein